MQKYVVHNFILHEYVEYKMFAGTLLLSSTFQFIELIDISLYRATRTATAFKRDIPDIT